MMYVTLYKKCTYTWKNSIFLSLKNLLVLIYTKLRSKSCCHLYNVPGFVEHGTISRAFDTLVSSVPPMNLCISSLFLNIF